MIWVAGWYLVCLGAVLFCIGFVQLWDDEYVARIRAERLQKATTALLGFKVAIQGTGAAVRDATRALGQLTEAMPVESLRALTEDLPLEQQERAMEWWDGDD